MIDWKPEYVLRIYKMARFPQKKGTPNLERLLQRVKSGNKPTEVKNTRIT